MPQGLDEGFGTPEVLLAVYVPEEHSDEQQGADDEHRVATEGRDEGARRQKQKVSESFKLRRAAAATRTHFIF